MLANIIHANTAEMTHDDTHAAPAWSLLSMNVRLLTLAYFLHTLRRHRNGVLLDPLIISKCIKSMIIYFYFQFLLLQKWLGLRTRYISRHSSPDTCHAIAVLIAASRHVQPAAAVAGLQHSACSAAVGSCSFTASAEPCHGHRLSPLLATSC